MLSGGSFQWDGRAKLILRNGPIVKKVVYAKNFVTEVGKAWAANRLTDVTDAAASHIAGGDGSGQDASDTTLDNETFRVALTSPYPNQGAGADDHKMLFVANVPAGTGTGTVSELGVFNASSSGTMINYISGFTPVDKESGDDLAIDITISIGG